MENREQITIKCKGHSSLELDALKIFQGDLKDLSVENYNKLKKSILKLGFSFPIHVWKNENNNYIVDGTQRTRTLQKMREEGYLIPNIPIVNVDADDFLQAKQKILAGTSQYGQLHDQGLYEFLGDSGIDWDFVKDLTRFPEIDLDKFEMNFFKDAEKEAIEDEIPEVTESICNTGDLWKLGDHFLLCGDSTKIEDVDRLMDGKKADFTITSPPYNVGLDYNSYDDKKTEEDYEKFLLKVMENIRHICTDNFWILWNVGVYPLSLHLHLLRNYFKIKRSIAWIKPGITGPPMIYHMKQNPVVKNYMPNFGWEIIACCHLDEKLKGTKKIPEHVIDECMTDVWELSPASSSKDQAGHPGAFPVKLAERAINLYADDIVFEPFCGSGTTLIASEKTGRKCYGLEMDPHYCSIIIKRFEQYSGKQAIKHSVIP